MWNNWDVLIEMSDFKLQFRSDLFIFNLDIESKTLISATKS